MPAYENRFKKQTKMNPLMSPFLRPSSSPLSPPCAVPQICSSGAAPWICIPWSGHRCPSVLHRRAQDVCRNRSTAVAMLHHRWGSALVTQIYSPRSVHHHASALGWATAGCQGATMLCVFIFCYHWVIAAANRTERDEGREERERDDDGKS